MRSLPIALAAAVVAATVSLACGQDEEAVPPDVTVAPTAVATSPTPPVKGQLWRWVDVTVVISEASGLDPIRTFSGLKPPSGGPVLELLYSENTNPVSQMSIDAETGTVLAEDVRPEDKARFQQVVDTLTVGPLDTAKAPWPYSDQVSADLIRESYSGISYIRPSPETGLQLTGGVGDPNGPFIGLTNGVSSVSLSTAGLSKPLSVDLSRVLAEDRPVFERWLSELRICGAEVAC